MAQHTYYRSQTRQKTQYCLLLRAHHLAADFHHQQGPIARTGTMFNLFKIRCALCLAHGIHTVVVGVGAAVDDATLQPQQVADVHRSTECNLVHLNEKFLMT